MTPSAYLWRKVKRLEQRHDLAGMTGHFLAQVHLQEHVEAKVRPSFTDTVWRSKRDGGPYRLDFGT